ncbi:hypothetical protein D3870_07075 [Noviherbaspirillum cavernae]|uniref:Type III secretion system effector protein n=2 Tax=Noviherbaspirillum cavernae TaxID=2320862 RepID=A0A418X044_9BURK|nr:hypothetical protein D3870_07075 [Noviherbaspirillum cavernae]
MRRRLYDLVRIRRDDHAEPSVPTRDDLQTDNQFQPDNQVNAPHLNLDENRLLNISRADLSDLLPALYGTAQNLANLGNNALSATYQQLADQAKQLADAPLESLKAQFLPADALNLGLSSSISAVVLPLAFIALRAGIRDTRKAIESNEKLNAREQLTQNYVRNLKALADDAARGNLHPLLGRYIHLGEQQAELLRFAKSMNKLSGVISASSATSSAIVIMHAGEELVAKGILGVEHGFNAAQLGTTAAGAATGLSIAGTLALTPLYGIASTAMASTLTYKSVKKQKNFRAGKEKVDAFLRNEINAESVRDQRYRRFLQTKLSQRAKFFRTNVISNSGFLAGSIVYTGTSIAKMAIVAAAMTGAGVAAANPVGASALLAMGIVGGLVMGAGSLKFLHSNSRQNRYDHYLIADDLELEREFLHVVDIMHPDGKSRGFGMRAHFYALISAREYRRQGLLAEIAEVNNKSYKPVHYSTDGVTLPPRQKADGSAWKKNIQARLDTELVRMKGFLKGKPRQAKEDARKEWGNKSDMLTSWPVQRWLENPANFPRQIDFMKAETRAQLAYLEEKMAARGEVFRRFGSNTGTAGEQSRPQGASQEENGNQLSALINDFLTGQENAAQRDALLVERGQTLMESLDRIKEAGEQTPDAQALEKLKSDFLHLQTGDVPDSAESAADTPQATDHLFAKFLRRESPKRYRDLRGILIETEIFAAKLRSRAEMEPVLARESSETPITPAVGTHEPELPPELPIHRQFMAGKDRSSAPQPSPSPEEKDVQKWLANFIDGDPDLKKFFRTE